MSGQVVVMQAVLEHNTLAAAKSECVCATACRLTRMCACFCLSMVHCQKLVSKSTGMSKGGPGDHLKIEPPSALKTGLHDATGELCLLRRRLRHMTQGCVCTRVAPLLLASLS